MNILIICLIIATVLPYLVKIPLMRIMKNEGQGYDNHYPRVQQARLTGYGARVLAAHQNSFESLIIFSSAVLTAMATQTITSFVEFLAILYLGGRLIYIICYLNDLSTLRSLVWAISQLASLGIFISCLIQVN